MPYSTVSSVTLRSSVHRCVKELISQNLALYEIKVKLCERFSECTGVAVAQNKLSCLKQDDDSIHEYISKFTDLLEHAYNAKPSDTSTKLLTNQLIEDINDSNKYTKNKLREEFGTFLPTISKQQLTYSISRKLGPLILANNPPFRPLNAQTQAMHTNSGACHCCGSLDHFIKDCPQNQAMNRYPQHKPSNPLSHPPNKPSYSDYEWFQAFKNFSLSGEPQSLVIVFTNSSTAPSQTRHTTNPNIREIRMIDSPKTKIKFRQSM